MATAEKIRSRYPDDTALLGAKCRCGHTRKEHIPKGRAPMLTTEFFIERGKCIWAVNANDIKNARQLNEQIEQYVARLT